MTYVVDTMIPIVNLIITRRVKVRSDIGLIFAKAFGLPLIRFRV